jgi:gliding motility-associated transport system ATP-binding protein
VSKGNGTATGDGRRPMIEAQGLSKYFGQFVATKDVTFSVPRGAVVAFLGPNGAGKSTTMKLLTGYLAPTSGVARIAGLNMATDRIEASKVMGYLPENGPLYNEMTPVSLLIYIGQARGMGADQLKKRLDFVREKCALDEVWHKPIGKLSRGFRQRVGMAQALLHDPDVLILDEPTSGLDPQSTREFLEMIRSLKHEGVTILLSSHLLDQVQSVCDRVALFSRGRIGLIGRVGDLLSEVLGGSHVIRVEAQGKGLEEAVARLSGVSRLKTVEGQLVVEARGDLRADIARAVVGAGGDLTLIAAGHASLADVYARYFEEVRDAA